MQLIVGMASEARRGSSSLCSTGVSAADRAKTIRALSASVPNPSALRRPGHIFPLIARDSGTLQRRGHTESAVDLCKLAGIY